MGCAAAHTAFELRVTRLHERLVIVSIDGTATDSATPELEPNLTAAAAYPEEGRQGGVRRTGRALAGRGGVGWTCASMSARLRPSTSAPVRRAKSTCLRPMRPSVRYMSPWDMMAAFVRLPLIPVLHRSTHASALCPFRAHQTRLFPTTLPLPCRTPRDWRKNRSTTRR